MLSFILLLLLFTSNVFSDSCVSGNCEDGHGIKEFSNGDRYEGEFKKGIFEGEGIFFSNKGYKYIGKFKEGKRNGFGIWTKENPIKPSGERISVSEDLAVNKSIYYEGEWKNNKYEGNGKLIIKKNGKTKIYTGKFVNGKLNGQGKLETLSGKYSGVFKNSKLNGHGVFEKKNGESYIGNFLNTKFDGKGAYTFKNKDLYIGDFKDGKLHGRGRLFNSKHRVIQSGKWENGEFKN
ncbi:MAG TPA: hypothetical protein PK079_16930 [Leptospiraceae bacterium]|nr:hypothetical protein [Leptospiraceae bacterium]HMW06123.1 hypothetical protein [Leptospiraceae bacterium]HMX30749.1 hypothetical protein [Leptospiraceae bacterium]HMY31784.1 hypothetical protein [Leptospiraceae bacterium]HMZ63115.1 hypothetical protein [Leptospiraceae bacterium]